MHFFTLLFFVAIFAAIFFVLLNLDRPRVFPLFICRIFSKRVKELSNVSFNYYDSPSQYSANARLTWQPKDCSHLITTNISTCYSGWMVRDSNSKTLKIPFRTQLAIQWHFVTTINAYETQKRADFYKKYATENLDKQDK